MIEYLPMLQFYLSFPLIFLIFWFYEAPLFLVRFFLSFNKAFLKLVSLPILLRTFFKPWKNEYRKGLVGFSIGMGMGIKAIVILADVFLLFLLIAVEFFAILLFILLPVITVLLPYIDYGVIRKILPSL